MLVYNPYFHISSRVPEDGQAVAAEEGRAVSEVVSERFGSLVALTGTLTDRRAAHGALSHLQLS